MDYEELSELSINDLWDRLQESEHAEKADTALVLSRRLLEQRSYSESMVVSEQAAHIGAQLNDGRVQGEAWFRVGICCFKLKRYEESADAYLKAVPFYLGESDEGSAANAIRHAVDGLHQQGKYEDVVRVCAEGETYAQIADNDYFVAELLSSRAGALIQLSRYEEALPVLESVRKLWRSHNEVLRVITTDVQIGDCYDSLGQEEKALGFFKNAFDLAEASESHKSIVYHGLRLARAYDQVDDFEPAERVLKRVYEIAAQHDDYSALASANAWMSNIYRQTERADLAYETAIKALTLFDSVDEPDAFDMTVAAAVLSPIAAERLDFAVLERSARILVDYYLSTDSKDGILEAAEQCLLMYEAQVEQGTYTEMSEEHSKLISASMHHVEDHDRPCISRRRLALNLEGCAAAGAWDEIEMVMPDFLRSGRPHDLALLDARAYVMLAKAQQGLGKPSSGSLAMAAAVFFSLQRFELALEFQDQALKAAVAELTGRPDPEITEMPDKGPDLAA